MDLNFGDYQAIGLAMAAVFAGWHARRANKQTTATGNGFAKSVKESLERIEVKGDETHRLMVEHLADHAGSDLTRR